MLHQFQCQKEGTLFYYQHGHKSVTNIIERCPVCGGRNVAPTGRIYPDVSEQIDVEEGRRQFLEAELNDAWKGEGNSKRIPFLKWVREMAANPRGTLQDAAIEYLSLRKKTAVAT